MLPPQRHWPFGARRRTIAAMTRLAIIFALMLSAAPAVAQEPVILGDAVALDGDTLLIDGGKVRIFGIDAPEMRDWPLGAYARAALDGILQGGPVTCLIVHHDRHKRPVGFCGTAANADIATAMISRGWAVPYRLFTYGRVEDDTPLARDAIAAMAAAYDAAEADARTARRGIWRDYDGD